MSCLVLLVTKGIYFPRSVKFLLTPEMEKLLIAGCRAFPIPGVLLLPQGMGKFLGPFPTLRMGDSYYRGHFKPKGYLYYPQGLVRLLRLF